MRDRRRSITGWQVTPSASRTGSEAGVSPPVNTKPKAKNKITQSGDGLNAVAYSGQMQPPAVTSTTSNTSHKGPARTGNVGVERIDKLETSVLTRSQGQFLPKDQAAAVRRVAFRANKQKQEAATQMGGLARCRREKNLPINDWTILFDRDKLAAVCAQRGHQVSHRRQVPAVPALDHLPVTSKEEEDNTRVSLSSDSSTDACDEEEEHLCQGPDLSTPQNIVIESQVPLPPEVLASVEALQGRFSLVEQLNQTLQHYNVKRSSVLMGLTAPMTDQELGEHLHLCELPNSEYNFCTYVEPRFPGPGNPAYSTPYHQECSCVGPEDKNKESSLEGVHASGPPEAMEDTRRLSPREPCCTLYPPQAVPPSRLQHDAGDDADDDAGQRVTADDRGLEDHGDGDEPYVEVDHTLQEQSGSSREGVASCVQDVIVNCQGAAMGGEESLCSLVRAASTANFEIETTTMDPTATIAVASDQGPHDTGGAGGTGDDTGVITNDDRQEPAPRIDLLSAEGDAIRLRSFRASAGMEGMEDHNLDSESGGMGSETVAEGIPEGGEMVFPESGMSPLTHHPVKTSGIKYTVVTTCQEPAEDSPPTAWLAHVTMGRCEQYKRSAGPRVDDQPEYKGDLRPPPITSKTPAAKVNHGNGGEGAVGDRQGRLVHVVQAQTAAGQAHFQDVFM